MIEPSLAPRAILLAAPLALPFLVPLDALPPALAYAVTGGRWLALCGVAAAVVALTPRRAGLRPRGLWEPVARLLDRVPLPRLWLVCTAVAILGGLLLVPGHRWSGATIGGDEPKYLRLAESLYRDLDVDVASQSTAPVGAGIVVRNLRALALSTRDAVRSRPRPDGPVPEGGWSRGNWTIAGRGGGLYYVQSPGLPAVLLPFLAVQRTLWPDEGRPLLPLVALVLLWATAAIQTARLAIQLSGSRTAGLAAALAAALSAPMLVGGQHFYPEAVAAAAVPWIARHALHAAPAVGRWRLAVLGLAAGALVWLHPKFAPLALTLAALLVIKGGSRRGWIAGVAFALPVAALLLFDRHVTGLLRPDAFYIRYADPFYGGPAGIVSIRALTGLVTGLFGARDGLFVIAPALAAGALAIPALWRCDRRTTLELFAVFASVWLAAALHEGGAPGPPGRLLAPVAFVPAVALAVGLEAWRRRLAFRWTAAALALVTLAISVTLLGDWRRAVNPYRGMFSEATNFSRDLPDGPRDPPVESSARRVPDLLRGAVLGALLVGWSLALARMREDHGTARDTWAAIRNLHLAWWGTIAGVGAVLHALGP